MIWVVVDHEVISTQPAPIGALKPVPCGHFKPESAGKSEPVQTRVESQNAVAVIRPHVSEVPVLERVVKMKTRIVGAIVPVLVIRPILRANRANEVSRMRNFPTRGRNYP